MIKTFLPDQIHQCPHWPRLWWPFRSSPSTHHCALSVAEGTDQPWETSTASWHYTFLRWLCVTPAPELVLTWQKPFIFSSTLFTSGITSVPPTWMGVLERFLRATWSTARSCTYTGQMTVIFTLWVTGCISSTWCYRFCIVYEQRNQ